MRIHHLAAFLVPLSLMITACSPANPPMADGEPVRSAPAAEVSESRLMDTVKRYAFERPGNGTDEQRKGLDKARKMLIEEVKSLGFEPTIETVPYRRAGDPAPDKPWPEGKYKPDPAANIIFEIPGSTLPGEVLLVAAHYDGVTNTVAADDNASGVAGLFEIARALNGRAMHRTVRFVLFDLEEVGLVGSRHHVLKMVEARRGENPDPATAQVVGMLSLEMLGYYDERIGSQKNPFKGMPGMPSDDIAGDFIALATTGEHTPFVRALDAAMKAAEPKVRTLVLDNVPTVAVTQIMRSDHAPFIAANMPGVMVTDTANFRNPHYHKPTDTPDKLNPTYFARTVRALAGGVHALAGPVEKGEAPRWIKPAPKSEAKPATKPAK